MGKRNKNAGTSGKAWRAAERFGCDMSLIEINLRKSVQERFRTHERALRLALSLRDAMEKRRDRP